MPHHPNPHEHHTDEVHAPRPVHYAEQALLGAILLEPHQLTAIDALDAGHFSTHAHGTLWQAMRELPPPDPDTHRSSPAWLNAVLGLARPHAPGLTATYLHNLIQVCPQPKHAPSYARMIRADHTRRTLLMHAERLAQTAADTTLPNPATTTLTQADALGQFLNTLAGRFAPHPGSLPRTLVHAIRAAHGGEEALDEEQLLLSTATAHPSALKDMRWLLPDDFTLPLHSALWQCLTTLVHNGEPVDRVTLLWEAQHRGLLADGHGPDDLIDLVSAPVGSPEHWGERVLQRALLSRAFDVGTRIAAYAQDPANTPHQLITGSRRALADLTSLRTRWQRSTSPPPPAARAPRGPAVARAGPPVRALTPGTRALR
ncbi:DnaB-like helicase N-terminal domain-containing protein [Streptomyces sp. NPDC057910]|uniref:DnaB-like helicase N-terminal domain-containing protein n=1 Tax=Streptomyces sp. NPDC057910 TaxID=3346278 RepID=UPI0036E8C010